MIRKFYSNPASAFMIILAVVVLGLVKFFSLPIALYPSTSKPKIVASMSPASTSAKDFLEQYGERIENTLEGLQDVETVSGSYYDGYVRYETKFDWGTEPEDAKESIRTSLEAYESEFPDEWSGFWYRYGDSQSSRVIVSAASEEYTPEELNSLLTDRLVPRLERIDGVSSVWVTRFDRKYVLITANPDRLASMAVAPDQIRKALAEKEYDQTLGELSLKDAGDFQVRLLKKNNSLDDIRQTIVGYRGKRPIRVRDVADVELKDVVPRRFFKGNGEKALMLVGNPTPDANIARFSTKFLQVVRDNTESLSGAVEVSTLLDPSIFINNAIRSIGMAVLIGVVVATLVIFLFLGSLRNTLIIGISIPMSLIGGFILMNALGIELNLISLGAMALAAGMVVDGAIVVLENIVRHMEEHKPTTPKERLDVLMKSVAQVRNPVIASLLTTIIVFAPLPFTSPLTSAILGDLATVMVCVLIISVLVTLLIVPPVALTVRAGLKRSDRTYLPSRLFQAFIDRCRRLYLWTLEKLLMRRTLKAGLAVAVLATLGVAFYLSATKVKREIMAVPNSDKVFLHVNFKNEEFELEKAERMIAPYENVVQTEFSDEIHRFVTQVRKSGGWILCFLEDKGRIDEVREALDERFQDTPLMNFHVEAWNPTSLEIPDPPVLRVFVNGRTDDEKRKTLKSIRETLSRDADSVGRIKTYPYTHKRDQYQVIADTEKLVRMRGEDSAAVSEAQLASLVRFGLEEREIMEWSYGGERIDVKMSFPENLLQGPSDLENLLLRSGNKILPLKTFADVKHSREWGHYYTENSKNIAMLEAWPKEKFKDERQRVRSEAREALAGAKEIPTERLSFADTEKRINDNIFSLIYALAIALLLIWIVISLQFGNLTQTGIIMLAIPLGFIGVAFSLFVFSSTLSVNSMLGLILLCGTAVNNSILFVDFYNQHREANPDVSVHEALIETANLRFRPILITTCTTVLGMIPIATGLGEGGEILQPLGIAVCGGLGLSTFLTLLVVPVAVSVGEGLRARWSGKVTQPEWKTAGWWLLIGLTGLGMGASSVRATEPRQVSLKEAEALALRHPVWTAAEAREKNAATAAKRGHFNEILPRVTASRSYEEQEVRFLADEIPGLGEDVTDTRKSGQTTVLVEEKIANPWRFWKEHEKRDNAVASASAQLEQEELGLVTRVRKQYFQVKTSEELLENAKRDFELAETLFAVSQRRYKAGYIHKTDLQRQKLLYVQTENALRVAQDEQAREAQKLGTVLGLKGKALDLTTPVPETFSFFERKPAFWKKRIREGEPPELLLLALAEEDADLSLDLARRDFFPDLTVGARYRYAEPGENPWDPVGPAYFLAVEWEIFSGGKNYYNMREMAERKYAARSELREATTNLTIAVRDHFSALEIVEDKLQTQSEVVDSWKEIADRSRRRFSQGALSAEQVDEDVRSYLEEQNTLIELRLEAVKQLADLAKRSGDPDLFREWL